MLAKQLLNYQCTEEQAHSVYSKMRSLKRMYLQSTHSFPDSEKDQPLNEDDVNKEPSNVNGVGSHFSSSTQKNMKLEAGEKSANKENGKGVKDKTAASEIDENLKKIAQKCDKRMKKLVRKQQQEIQEFQRVWEKKRQDLEDDHKLELAFIRSIQYEDLVGSNKLKVLEDKFAKKIEEHCLLKDAQLKELEAKQVAAINEERLKATDWLAKAKACSPGVRAINGQQLVNSQSDDDAERPQPSTPVNIIASWDVLPMSGQHVGPETLNRSSQANDVAPLTSSVKTPVENIVTTNIENEAGVTSLAIVELNNQSKHSSDNGETVSSNVPAAPVEQRDETARSLGSAQLQDSDAPAVQNRTTSQVEVPILELVESVSPVPSNHETPATDEIVTPIPLSHEDPVNSRSGQQPFSLVSMSLHCNQAPATENNDQGRCSPQAAAELLFHESMSLSEDILGTQSVESPAALQNDVSIPQVATSPSEQSNPGVDRPSNNILTTHQSTSWCSTLTDPLQKELEMIRDEIEQLEKTRENTMSQLKADCEKEIKEFISQIRNKYGMKLQESEAEFRSKRNELDKNQNKVLLNKILAGAVRWKSLELTPSGSAQQGGPSNSVQQLHQVPPSTWIRCSPGSGSQPAHIHPIATSPALQTPQQLPRSHPSRSFPVAIQTVAPPTITAQPVQPPISGPPPRPPLINAISPAGNRHCAGNELRSIAPHLQPARPTVASSTPPTTSPSPAQLQPVQTRLSQPGLLPQAPQQPLSNLVTTSPSATQLQPVQRRPSQPSLLPRAPQQPSSNLVTTSPSAAQLQPVQTRPSQPGPLPQAPQLPSSNLVTTSPSAAQLQPVQTRPSQPDPLPWAPQQPSSNLVTTSPLGPQLQTTQMGPPQQPSPGGLQDGVRAPPNPSPTTDGPSVPERRIPSLPYISATFSSLEPSDLEMLGSSVQGNQTSAVASDVCISD